MHLHITLGIFHFTNTAVLFAFTISALVQLFITAFVMDAQRSGADGTCENTFISADQPTIVPLNGCITAVGPLLASVLLLSGAIMLASLLGVETAGGLSTRATTEDALQLSQQVLGE